MRDPVFDPQEVRDLRQEGLLGVLRDLREDAWELLHHQRSFVFPEGEEGEGLMPGRTGKRAKPPKPCGACGKEIFGPFNRERDTDYHQECWWLKRGKPLKLAVDLSGSTCEEASSLSVTMYMPCGRPAIAIIWQNKDRRAYTMCDGCADHNLTNRGGIRLVAAPSVKGGGS
jgi:hypothetical protein